MELSAIASRFDGVRWSGNKAFVAFCRAHPNTNTQALSVSEATDGRKLAHCHAGCTFAEIVASIGLTPRDFAPTNGGPPFAPPRTSSRSPRAPQARSPRPPQAAPITLAALARAKHFTEEFLRAEGVDDFPEGKGVGVGIGYFLEDETQHVRLRRRSALKAKDGSYWVGPEGISPIPYGLWRLADARRRRFLIIVEGETDCWALWVHDWPALGLPGATNAKCLEARHLEGIDKVYIVQEPDAAGAEFPTRVAARLRAVGFEGEALALVMPAGAKDPCDLHIAGTFEQEFQWAIENAQPINTLLSPPQAARVDCNIAGNDLELRSRAAFVAIAAANAGPELYSNGEEPVLLTGARAVPVNLDRLRQWMTAHINFQTYDRQGNLTSMQPQDVLVQNVKVYQPSPLPLLKRVVRRPAFTADGRLILESGYDRASGLVYAASAALGDLRPGEDVEESLALLNELICDFNFETTADRAHFFSCLFQPIFRELIDGPTPIYRFEAPKAGTGKGLLFGLIATIHGGYVFTTPHGNDEEWGKSLLTHLRTNPEILLIDNCSNLDSDQLAAATTAWPTWSARLLGTLDSFTVPVRPLWAVTINNPQLKEDAYRRTARIRICPPIGVENPAEYTGFRHRPLRAYLQNNLKEFVTAVLTLAVYAKARMKPFTARTMGSYDEWASVMGGVLEALGIKGFLEPIEGADLARDRGSSAWKEFVMLWRERFADQWMRSANLLSAAQQTDLELGNGNDRSQQITLGKLLARRRGGVFEKFLVDSRVWQHALQYRLVEVTKK